MNNQDSQRVVQALLADYKSKISAGQSNPVAEIQNLKLDLSQTRDRNNALKVSFPFKSLRVEEASDLDTFVYLVPENNDMGRGFVKLGLNDVVNTEWGFSCAFIFWEKQEGKEISLNFYTTSKVDNGRLVIDNNSEDNNLKLGTTTTKNVLTQVLDYESDLTENFSGRQLIGFKLLSDQILLSSQQMQEYADNGGGAAYADRYVVPEGYTALVVGCECFIQDIADLDNTTSNLNTYINAFCSNENDITNFNFQYSGAYDVINSIYPSNKDYQAMQFLELNRFFAPYQENFNQKFDLYVKNILNRIENPLKVARFDEGEAINPYVVYGYQISPFMRMKISLLIKLYRKVGS